MVKAVVLAGTHKNRKRLINGINKAFCRIDDVFVVNYVIDALKKAKSVHSIVLVGPKDGLERMCELEQIHIDTNNVVRENGDFLENAMTGYEKAREIHNPKKIRMRDDYTWFFTADIPLLSSDTIDDFYSKCELVNDSRADVYFPIIRKESIGEHNILDRKYVPAKEGDFRICNFLLANVDAIKNRDWIEKCFNGRVLRTYFGKARLLFEFPDIFCRYIYSRHISRDSKHSLSLNHIKEKASEKFGAKFEFVEVKDSGASLDIDCERDFNYIKNVIISGKYTKYPAQFYFEPKEKLPVEVEKKFRAPLSQKPFQGLWNMLNKG